MTDTVIRTFIRTTLADPADGATREVEGSPAVAIDDTCLDAVAGGSWLSDIWQDIVGTPSSQQSPQPVYFLY